MAFVRRRSSLRPPAAPRRTTSERRLRAPLSDAGAPATSESRLRAAAPAEAARPESGEYALRYALVRALLRGYLSPMMVDSVLNKAMQARGMTPSLLSSAALAEITSDIMIGLRLFVDERRLPQLMVELAEVLDGGDS